MDEISIDDPKFNYVSGYNGGLYWIDTISPTQSLSEKEKEYLIEEGWEYIEGENIWEKHEGNNIDFYRS